MPSTGTEGQPVVEYTLKLEDGWQPIETAPATGERILVFNAKYRDTVSICKADGDFWRRERLGPTHWMPLPAPPTSVLQEAGDE